MSYDVVRCNYQADITMHLIVVMLHRNDTIVIISRPRDYLGPSHVTRLFPVASCTRLGYYNVSLRANCRSNSWKWARGGELTGVITTFTETFILYILAHSLTHSPSHCVLLSSIPQAA